MTLQEALDMADEMKPNMMKRETKIRHLTDLEEMIWAEIVMKHVHTPQQAVKPHYTDDSDPGTVLLVPDPYSSLYPFWIMSRIDLLNQELDKYNNDRALFENAYNEMHDWWNRTKMPVQRNRQIWI